MPSGVALVAADEARKMLRDAVDFSSVPESNRIANGTPQSLAGKMAQAAARHGCRRWAANPGLVDDKFQAQMDLACRPYLEDIGEYPFPPEFGKPFDGGQCPGARYFFQGVTAVYKSKATGQNQTLGPVTTSCSGAAPYIGPISDLRVGAVPGSSTVGVIVTERTGTPQQQVRSVAFGIPPDQIEGNLRLTGGSAAPCPAQPNNCGDPPPNYRPPGPPVTIPPNPFPFNPGPDIDVDIDVDFGPGGITIDFGDGPITVDPFPDDGGGGGGGGGGTPAPGDRGNPGPTQDSGDGPPEGEAPPGQVLTGVLVDAIFINDFVNKTEIPNFVTVYRGVCYVLIGGEPGLELQPEGSTVIFPQFFEAPENSTKWKVIPNKGYRLSVTPYYKEVEEEE